MDAYDYASIDREVLERLRKEGKVKTIPPEDPERVRNRDRAHIDRLFDSSGRKLGERGARDDRTDYNDYNDEEVTT